jgi:hypothetical protein
MNVQRVAPLTGILFAVLFLAGVVVSSPPANTAPDRDWLASYTGAAAQLSHLATGVCLVLAALSLLAFLTVLWNRISEARRSPIGPLPLVAAGTAAACIAAGGVLMGGISGGLLLNPGEPVPPADLLRLGNDLGFGMVGLAGMLAADLSVVLLAFEARAAGVFGPRLFAFSMVVGVLLLGALAFLPILALLAWCVVAGVALTRRQPDAPATGRMSANVPLVSPKP